MTAARTGAVVAAVVAAWLFLLSGWVGVTPGRPAAERCDVFFQSDAGQRVLDAARRESSFGAGSHLLPHLLWPRALHAACGPDPAAAVYVCRGVAALAVGLGVGWLAAALVRAGVRPHDVLLFAPVWLLATGQVLVCLPDHFALSAGLLPAAFGVFLDRRGRPLLGSAVRLGAFAGLAGGVCVTNAVFPILLFAGLLADRYRPSARWYFLTAGLGLLAVGGVVAVAPRLDPHGSATWQVRHWLNLRLTGQPAEAVKRMMRTPIDVAVGPTPAVDTNNAFRVPMLTYEPSGEPYRAWPYDGVRTVAAVAWLGLLGGGVWRAARDPATRLPAAVLGVWVGWNLVFHNIWGDEFFLYTPHYGWAVLTLAALRPVPIGPRLPLLAAVVIGQAVTLMDIRRAADALPPVARGAVVSPIGTCHAAVPASGGSHGLRTTFTHPSCLSRNFR